MAAEVPASLLARRPDFAAAEQQVLATFRQQEAVCLATIQYQSGRRDLLWLANLKADEIAIRTAVVKTRNLQRANRINRHLALGGSLNASPTDQVAVR
ncbi:MAG: hypothetical protein WBG92_00705 [Thiohalocapsa sp.]